ncbi:protein-(glutamine-N5) methyltransferase [Achlya hypogyna]|uniref:Protein-(Glutamine-N5) methyltransferase n=1 Tax=Achlya hypogyna TaxID=1202772 RepID=A0A1V9ZEX3_ACHHY|nr:protein-(glutamine-N5) methyltransferase [Achlya hypogyna]
MSWRRWSSTVASARRALRARGLGATDASSLVRHAFSPPMSAEALFLAPERPMSAGERTRLEGLAARRLAGEPLAYVVGVKEFWSLPFHVTPATLIPRPETELLLDLLLQRCPDKDTPLRVLDLGTGSGCLVVAALREYPHATGVAVDISVEALAVAARNARDLGISHRVSFLEQDMTTLDASAIGTFDVVLCNPPYIAAHEEALMDDHVVAYEPHTALFAARDGLAIYEALVPSLPALVTPRGHVLLEVGFAQAAAVADLFRGASATWSPPLIVQDLCAVPRCVAVHRVEG